MLRRFSCRNSRCVPQPGAGDPPACRVTCWAAVLPQPHKAARERLPTTTAAGSFSLQVFGSFLWDLYSAGMWFFPLVSCLYSFFSALCSCFAFMDRRIIFQKELFHFAETVNRPVNGAFCSPSAWVHPVPISLGLVSLTWSCLWAAFTLEWLKTLSLLSFLWSDISVSHYPGWVCSDHWSFLWIHFGFWGIYQSLRWCEFPAKLFEVFTSPWDGVSFLQSWSFLQKLVGSWSFQWSLYVNTVTVWMKNQQ